MAVCCIFSSVPSSLAGMPDFLMSGKERDSKEKVVRKAARSVEERHIILCHQRLLFAQKA